MNRVLAGAAAFAAVAWGWAFWPASALVRVECLDVGPGQCVVVTAGGGASAVINPGIETAAEGGGDGSISANKALARAGVNSLDAVVLTRLDADAASAVDGILKEHPEAAVVVGTDDVAAAGHTWKGARISALADGGVVDLRGKLRMRPISSGGSLEGLLWAHGDVTAAFVDGSIQESQTLRAARPAVVICSYRLSRSAEKLEGPADGTSVVLHSGRRRDQWANFGLDRSLKQQGCSVHNIGRDGGAVFRMRPRRVEMITVRKTD